VQRKLISVDLRCSQNFLGESALSLERIANRFFEETASVVVQKSWWKGLHRFLIAVLVLSLGATSLPTIALAATPSIAEASTPPVIQALRRKLDRYQPQVQILTPKAGETVQDTSISLKFAVKDLPIYKDAKLGLGPHLHVFLDEDNYQAVYDLSQPLVLKDLKPGTHTIRVFASRPWHESFKNDGAFAQVSFNVFTATQDDRPNPDLPLLTYSRPQGSYGAEPIMLDYYLTNAPLHLVADDDKTVRDWRVKATIDGTSFILDKWQPIYLKGLPTGQNWAQLEFVDAKGEAIANVFNNTVKLFDYQPGGSDALSKLVRGELTEAEAMGIVDPNYVPTVAPPAEAKPAATPAVEAKPEVKPAVKPDVKPTVKPDVKPAVPTETPKSAIAKPAAAAAAAGAAAAAKLIAPKIMPTPAATPKPAVVKPEVKAPAIKIPVVKPEVKPTPKVEVKVAPKKVEPKKVEAKPIAPKVEPKKVEVKVAPKTEPKVEPKKVEAKPIEKSGSPFDGFLNRFKSNDPPTETVKSIAKPAAAAAGAAAATKLIAPKIMPTVTPKPAAKPEVKVPAIKTPIVKPEVKAPTVVKPVIKAPAPTVVKTPAPTVVKTPAPTVVKTPAPAVKRPAATPAKPATPKADDNNSPFGGFLNRFKSAAPAKPIDPPANPVEVAKPAATIPAVKSPEKPVVKIPVVKTPEKPVAKPPAAVKPAAPVVAKPTPPIAKPAPKPEPTKPSGNFFDRFKAAPEPAATPENTTVPTNRVPTKPVATPKSLTQPAIKPIKIQPAAIVRPTAIVKPAAPTKPTIPAQPAKPAVKAVAPAAIVKPAAPKPIAPALTPKPVEVKPESGKFDYLKKYLDKPATAKSIVTKPAAQPIPGKAANPQPANAIVPKSTTRLANPAPKPDPKPLAPSPVRASGRSPQPAKPAIAPSAKTAITKSNIEEKSALDNLELPKDVRNLFDRLPMPKEKPDELVPIGKLLGK
jgi:hypothetical protein